MQERWLGQDVENWRPPHFDQLGPVDPSRLPSAWAPRSVDESDDDSSERCQPGRRPGQPRPRQPARRGGGAAQSGGAHVTRAEEAARAVQGAGVQRAAAAACFDESVLPPRARSGLMPFRFPALSSE